jgi:hypothetical protein
MRLRAALAIVLLRDREVSRQTGKKEPVDKGNELAFLRKRLLDMGACHPTEDLPVLAEPSLPASAPLLSWLEARDGTDMNVLARAGIDLLRETCAGRTLDALGGCEGACRVLQQVIHAEQAIWPSHAASSIERRELPSIQFARTLCHDSIAMDPPLGSSKWLSAIEAMVLCVAATHRKQMLSVLAHATLGLVKALSKNELRITHILGAQPVISALQYCIENLAREQHGCATRNDEPDDWRLTLQQACDATIDYSACSLLAQSIWHLCILADQTTGCPESQGCRQYANSLSMGV